MHPLQRAEFPAQQSTPTTVNNGDREVTSFIANEYWQSVSETNGADPTPPDADS